MLNKAKLLELWSVKVFLKDTLRHFHPLSLHSFSTFITGRIQDFQQGIYIGEKLDVRQMEGFINGGWRLYIFPFVFPLNSSTMKLS
jgi:hypothetical protein